MDEDYTILIQDDYEHALLNGTRKCPDLNSFSSGKVKIIFRVPSRISECAYEEFQFATFAMTLNFPNLSRVVHTKKHLNYFITAIYLERGGLDTCENYDKS